MFGTSATRAKLSALALGAAAAVVGAAAPAHAEHADAPDVPTAIEVEDGHKVFLVARASGVQIYRCDAVGAGSAWALVAPRASLTDDDGRSLGTHFGGPTWQAKDGSSVHGRRVDGVTVDPRAIPWLLIEADASSVGADGDRFTNTSFIQRTATTGGLPPAASGCTTDTTGAVVEVPYTADYHFWKPTGS